MKNRDKLNQMSNEELASFIFNTKNECELCANSEYSEEFDTYSCTNWNKDCCEQIQLWLESEVE